MKKQGLGQRALGVTRWAMLAAVAFAVVAIVQSLRHPARLWSPGLMGRVLAWDIEPVRAHDGGSATR